MFITEKMLDEFRYQTLECLMLWADYDADVFNKYIEEEIRDIYQRIIKITCVYDNIHDNFMPFLDNMDIDIYYDENIGAKSYRFRLHCNAANAIPSKKFLEYSKNAFDGLFDGKTCAEFIKYMAIPGGYQFIVEIHHRIHFATALLNVFNGTRNKLNNIITPFISKEDEMLSSLFCSTLWHILANGDIVADGGQEEFDYVLRDPFGIVKYIESDIYVNKNGEILISNCRLVDY